MNLHPTIANGLGTFEMLRRFGFSPDELFTGWALGNAYCVLRTQEKEFSITLGQYDAGDDAWCREWPKAAAAWNTTMSEEDRWICFSRSEAYNRTRSLRDALRAKGIVIPNLQVDRIQRDIE